MAQCSYWPKLSKPTFDIDRMSNLSKERDVFSRKHFLWINQSSGELSQSSLLEDILVGNSQYYIKLNIGSRCYCPFKLD